MKSRILTLAVFFFAVIIGNAYGQTDDLDAKVNVIDKITISQFSELNFGTVLVGNDVVLDPIDGSTDKGGTPASSDATFGILDFDAGSGTAEITISSTDVTGVDNEITLQTDDETLSTTADLSFAYNNAGESTGDSYDLDDVVSLSDGEGRLIVGGSFDANGVDQGLYTAEITFTVELN